VFGLNPAVYSSKEALLTEQKRVAEKTLMEKQQFLDDAAKKLAAMTKEKELAERRLDCLFLA